MISEEIALPADTAAVAAKKKIEKNRQKLYDNKDRSPKGNRSEQDR